MEKVIIDYLVSFGMSEDKAKENLKLLIANNELIDFYNNINQEG
jgi:hypothetical protein